MEDVRSNTVQLYGSSVVGEDVRMVCCLDGALLPPPLMTQVEDKDGEKATEEDLSDGVSSEDENCSSGVKAVVEHRIQGGVNLHICCDGGLKGRYMRQKKRHKLNETMSHNILHVYNSLLVLLDTWGQQKL